MLFPVIQGMLQEGDCWLLGKAFAPQAELSFAVSIFPVPAAAPFPPWILCPLSCHRSHPIPSHLGTVRPAAPLWAAALPLPHQLLLSSFRNTFYSRKDVPERKTKKLEPAWPRGWFLHGLGGPDRAVAPSREFSPPSPRAEQLQGSSSACQPCSIPRASHSPLRAFNDL